MYWVQNIKRCTFWQDEDRSYRKAQFLYVIVIKFVYTKLDCYKLSMLNVITIAMIKKISKAYTWTEMS